MEILSAEFLNRIINSRIFKFVVGEEADDSASEFFIHEEAVTQLSKPLHGLLKGNFSEAQTACTVWKDVSKDTFERLIQFAYTGDYSIPEPVNRRNDDNGAVSSSREAENDSKILKEFEQHPEVFLTGPTEEDLDDAWGTWGIPKKDKKKKKTGTQGSFFLEKYPKWSGPRLAESFSLISYPLLAPRNYVCDLTLPFDKKRSYANILLCHATMYVLGDLWMIETLKALALFKLHHDLCIFQLDDTNAEDILELARFAYCEEGKGSEEGIGGLRGLVCQYMASNAVVLSLDNGFMDLLEEGGQFVRDLWKFEVQRIH